ncbi:MAG: phage tail sheath subtilisin-like domain-containing protein [Candidatus Methanoperedens sp.]|nr:phage tail sheath subtilisin-like domain-containing protein [Candidatus Methanoperedens sp.]CAG0963815.1 Putative prophage major tail sheath protein [Methanosarcinales archaeon]
MPEYLTPGVYVEEFEIGARPIEGVSTSTAGFLGLAERGPYKPMLVTSLTQYMRYYGGYTKDSYLTYAVEGFFNNGGQRCYIGRIVRLDPDGNPLAVKASLPVGPFRINAIGEGEWGNRVAVRIEDATNDLTKFKLTVAYWSKNKVPIPEKFQITGDTEKDKKKFKDLIESANKIEEYDDLSDDPDSPYYYLKRLNVSDTLSFFVYLDSDSTATGKPPNTTGNFFNLLTAGSDGPADQPWDRGDFLGNPNADAGEKRGLTALNDLDDISILYVPDAHMISNVEARQTFYGDILTQCELLKDRFAIIDVKENNSNISTLNIVNVARSSKYGAIYYPWIKLLDPLTERMKQVPPGGHIAGIYARSDTERGVHKAPANEIVKGANDLEFNISKADQGILNPRGINVIRSFNGRGILVWGARTCIIDPLWKYINVRRLFIYVEKSIEKGTQWVVFEPNNERLWGRVVATIGQFLNSVWKDGALMGKPEEAFFVKCDRTTMTQDDIDNGRLICIIGIAPAKPAEFVIFRIAQWAGGSSSKE